MAVYCSCQLGAPNGPLAPTMRGVGANSNLIGALPMPTRKLYMVLDTETVTPARTVFDLGYRIIDRKGEVYATGSYLVRETVATVDGIGEMVTDSFTKSKAPRYLASVIGGMGEFDVVDFATLREEVNMLIDRYNPVLAAYNITFDLNALNKTSQKLLGVDFFDRMPELFDIWAAAMSTICKAARYIQFIADNGITTDKGNPQTGAEAVYKFITGNTDFEEAHTAAADCEIEAEIFAACLKTHRKMKRTPVRMCMHDDDWKEIVARYHAYAD